MAGMRRVIYGNSGVLNKGWGLMERYVYEKHTYLILIASSQDRGGLLLIQTDMGMKHCLAREALSRTDDIAV